MKTAKQISQTEEDMSNALERWLDVKRQSPFRESSQIEDTFDRLFNEITNSKKRSSSADALNFYPNCDICEDNINYIFNFDMPGVNKEQVHVEVNNDQLSVRAERLEEKKSDTKKKHLSEVSYGSYTRSFTLPGPVDEKNVSAKFENGVLTVSIPKTATAKVKQIPVH